MSSTTCGKGCPSCGDCGAYFRRLVALWYPEVKRERKPREVARVERRKRAEVVAARREFYKRRRAERVAKKMEEVLR